MCYIWKLIGYMNMYGVTIQLIMFQDENDTHRGTK